MIILRQNPAYSGLTWYYKHMRKRSELFFSFILVPLDFIALVSAFVVAYIIRVKLDGRPVAHPIGALLFLKISLLILPIWILIFALSGLYNLSNLRGRFSELGKVFVAVSGGVMVLILLDFLNTKQPIFPSKSVPIYAYGFGIIFVVFARTIVRMVQRYLFRFGIGVHRVLLVGSGELAQRMAADLMSPNSGFRLVAAIDSAKGAAKRLPGVIVYKNMAEAEPVLKEGIDQLLQADSALDPDEIFELVRYATNHYVSYRFVPNQFGLFATNSTFGNIAGIPVLEIRLTPLDGWGRIVKRIFDIVGASFGLVILSPIFLLTAIAIKLSDKGPVLYKQQRLSRTGTPIYIYKFRSMYAKFSSGANYGQSAEEVLSKLLKRPDLAKQYTSERKLADDPRVTPLGKFIRRTSIDELPQLFNVLVGTLSLVGPRPILAEELHYYGEEVGTFLALKPGLTGLWQISGRSDIGFEEKVKLDIYYVEHWNLGLDIKILLKTVVTVLRSGGAY